MALQTTGAITLQDIADEFGGTTPHSLSEYYDAADGVPVSGEISVSDFYGKANTILIDYLVVAGGGDGGRSTHLSSGSGGGGAGGSLSGTIETTLSTSFSLSVGARKQDSTFDTVTVNAGGDGGNGGGFSGQSGAPGGAGGGGGGSAYFTGAGSGGAGNTPSTTPSQGNDGQNGFNTNSDGYCGCGGGRGGNGSVTSWHGVWSGASGGSGSSGAVDNTQPPYSYNEQGETAADNSGSGGGGSGQHRAEGLGGSGVVIVRYPGTQALGTGGDIILTTAGQSYELNGSRTKPDDGYIYHIFKTTGSATFTLT